MVADITRLAAVVQRVAANATKTTAANAAAETCLSEGLPLVEVADGELEVLEAPAPLLEEPAAAVVVTNPEGLVPEVPVPVEEEPEAVAVGIAR